MISLSKRGSPSSSKFTTLPASIYVDPPTTQQEEKDKHIGEVTGANRMKKGIEVRRKGHCIRFSKKVSRSQEARSHAI
jgi:hypothetical protein